MPLSLYNQPPIICLTNNWSKSVLNPRVTIHQSVTINQLTVKVRFKTHRNSLSNIEILILSVNLSFLNFSNRIDLLLRAKKLTWSFQISKLNSNYMWSYKSKITWFGRWHVSFAWNQTLIIEWGVSQELSCVKRSENRSVPPRDQNYPLSKIR